MTWRNAKISALYRFLFSSYMFGKHQNPTPHNRVQPACIFQRHMRLHVHYTCSRKWNFVKKIYLPKNYPHRIFWLNGRVRNGLMHHMVSSRSISSKKLLNLKKNPHGEYPNSRNLSVAHIPSIWLKNNKIKANLEIPLVYRLRSTGKQ